MITRIITALLAVFLTHLSPLTLNNTRKHCNRTPFHTTVGTSQNNKDITDKFSVLLPHIWSKMSEWNIMSYIQIEFLLPSHNKTCLMQTGGGVVDGGGERSFKLLAEKGDAN